MTDFNNIPPERVALLTARVMGKDAELGRKGQALTCLQIIRYDPPEPIIGLTDHWEWRPDKGNAATWEALEWLLGVATRVALSPPTPTHASLPRENALCHAAWKRDTLELAARLVYGRRDPFEAVEFAEMPARAICHAIIAYGLQTGVLVEADLEGEG